ncbi:MAG: hypothetical protein JWQ43_1410 [Glaciihabitans sp.]|nr:hypothetical protein [Glaciihabitans sp.]
MRATLRLTATAALATLILTGCTQTVALKPAEFATDPQCAEVITRLPDVVDDDLQQRETNAQGTSAWGSPSDILLRCGVPVPDPTAELDCITLDGIDWLRDPADDPNFVFTTYGRDPAIEVIVNSVNASGTNALNDLSSAISIIPADRACVSPEDVFGSTTPTATPTPVETDAPAE